MGKDMMDYIKIARPDHWIKNMFILPGVVVGILLAGTRPDAGLIVRIAVGFAATCLISSANYVINEWLDAEFDRYHPVKKFRPVVTGQMKFRFILLEYFLLAASGLGLSLLVNGKFVWTEIWLLLMGVVYNVKPLRTKDVVYVDVLSESVNNLIRLLLGWFIVSSRYFPPVSILVGYWMAGAFLMGTKRLAEYRMIGDPELAGRYRKSFRSYTEVKLLGSSLFYAMAATFCMGIFMVKYRIEYLLSMPILFWLFAHYLMLAYQEDSVVQKPEKLYREGKLLAIVGIFAIALVALTFLDIPRLETFSTPYLIEME